MKKIIIPTIALIGLSSAAFIGGKPASASTVEKTKSSAIITPMVAYDYSIPSFELTKNETAFSTRSGYGFYVNKDGLNHNDFDITFNIYNSGNYQGILGLVSFDDWNDASKRSLIQQDPKKYSYKYATFSGNGDKSIHFYDLGFNTKWVFVWKNTGPDKFYLKNGHVGTSY